MGGDVVDDEKAKVNAAAQRWGCEGVEEESVHGGVCEQGQKV